jgi:hypothetical protein
MEREAFRLWKATPHPLANTPTARVGLADPSDMPGIARFLLKGMAGSAVGYLLSPKDRGAGVRLGGLFGILLAVVTEPPKPKLVTIQLDREIREV